MGLRQELRARARVRSRSRLQSVQSLLETFQLVQRHAVVAVQHGRAPVDVQRAPEVGLGLRPVLLPEVDLPQSVPASGTSPAGTLASADSLKDSRTRSLPVVVSPLMEQIYVQGDGGHA